MATTRDVGTELDEIRRRLKITRERSIAAAVIALVVAAVWVGDTVLEMWIAKKGNLGGQSLVLDSPDGTMRGVLGAGNADSTLVLRNAPRDSSAGMSVQEDGTSCLRLSRDGHEQVKLSVPSEGGQSLEFSRPTGKMALACGAGREGNSYLVLCDGEGVAKVVVTVDAYGSGRIQILDGKGDVVWQAP